MSSEGIESKSHHWLISDMTLPENSMCHLQ